MIAKFQFIALFLTLISILVYSRVLFFTLLAFKIKKNMSFFKELAYTAAVFIPFNLVYFLMQYYLVNPVWNLPLFLALIVAIVFPIKYLYNQNWKKTLLISAIWFVSVLVIGFVLNVALGLILLA